MSSNLRVQTNHFILCSIAFLYERFVLVDNSIYNTSAKPPGSTTFKECNISYHSNADKMRKCKRNSSNFNCYQYNYIFNFPRDLIYNQLPCSKIVISTKDNDRLHQFLAPCWLGSVVIKEKYWVLCIVLRTWTVQNIGIRNKLLARNLTSN